MTINLTKVSALALAVGGSAVVATTSFGSLIEERMMRGLGASGIRVASVNVSFVSGSMTLAGLHREQGDTNVRISEVRLPLSSLWQDMLPIRPALANDVVALRGITAKLGTSEIVIPELQARSVSLGETELKALIEAMGSPDTADRLRSLNAAEIVIPTLTLVQRFGGQTQRTTYNDIRLRDIAGGRVAAMTGGSSVFEMPGEDGQPVKGSFGAWSVDALDLPHLLALYTQPATAPDEPMRPVYGAFSLSGLTLTSGDEISVHVAQIGGGAFRARRTKTPWGSLAEQVAALESKTGQSDDDEAKEAIRMMAIVSDILEAYEIDSVEARDMKVSAKADAPKNSASKVGASRTGSPKTDTAGGTFTIARIFYRGGSDSRSEIEGVEIASEPFTGRVGRIVSSGFSMAPAYAALRETFSRPDANLDEIDLRRFIPTLGTSRLEALTFDAAADPDKPNGERVTGRMGAYEIAFGTPRNGIPTSIRMALENLAMTLPPSILKESGSTDLAALGYRDIDLSAIIDGSWNEPGQEFLVREISIAGKDMGSARLRGVIGGIGPDVFSTDTALAQTALFGATAKSVSVEIENTGLADRLIAEEARKRKMRPDDVRKEYGMTAQLGIPAILGNSPQAKALASAVARFAAKPGKLTIEARTKDGAGLGLSDMALAGEPEELMNRLDVTAKAE